MKNTSFFKQKAESFLEQLNSLNPKDYKFNHFDNNNDYSNQSKELEDIKFQIKLMFSEFDNGNLFLEKLNSFNNVDAIFDNQPKIIFLKEINKLFIDFLVEYRD